MLRQLKQLIRLNLDDLVLIGGILGGAFLLLQVVIAIVMAVVETDGSILISHILLLTVAGFLSLCCTLGGVMLHFDQALRFGQTRRHALGLTAGLAGFEAAFTLALMALLIWLERTFAPRLWMLLSGASGYEVTVGGHVVRSAGTDATFTLLVDGFVGLSWWWYPLVLLGTAALGFMGAAVVQRFGSRGGWFLWAVFMVGCLGPQLIGKQALLIGDWTQWTIAAAAVLLPAGLIWSVWSLLHAVIKS